MESYINLSFLTKIHLFSFILKPLPAKYGDFNKFLLLSLKIFPCMPFIGAKHRIKGPLLFILPCKLQPQLQVTDKSGQGGVMM